MLRIGELKPVINELTGDLLGWVKVDSQGRPGQAYTDRQVVPIWYYNPVNPLAPLSPLRAARLSVEQEFYMNAWNSAFFKQGLKNPMAIKTKKNLSTKQKQDLEK
jgi:phage portal protein BeeE